MTDQTNHSLASYLTTRQGNVGCCPAEPRNHCVSEYRRQKEIQYLCYDAWLPNVRILAPHVADAILLDYIRAGCIEFARQSKILTRNIELETQCGVADYWPCLGEWERIERVRLLSVNGCCYQAVGDSCTWCVGEAKYWFHPPNSLEIHPAPKECAQVILTVVGVPDEASTRVDRLLHDRYFAPITSYAVAQALLVPLRDDSDKTTKPDKSAYPLRMAEFSRGVARAKVDAAQHFSSQPGHWR